MKTANREPRSKAQTRERRACKVPLNALLAAVSRFQAKASLALYSQSFDAQSRQSIIRAEFRELADSLAAFGVTLTAD